MLCLHGKGVVSIGRRSEAFDSTYGEVQQIVPLNKSHNGALAASRGCLTMSPTVLCSDSVRWDHVEGAEEAEMEDVFGSVVVVHAKYDAR